MLVTIGLMFVFFRYLPGFRFSAFGSRLCKCKYRYMYIDVYRLSSPPSVIDASLSSSYALPGYSYETVRVTTVSSSTLPPLHDVYSSFLKTKTTTLTKTFLILRAILTGALPVVTGEGREVTETRGAATVRVAIVPEPELSVHLGLTALPSPYSAVLMTTKIALSTIAVHRSPAPSLTQTRS